MIGQCPECGYKAPLLAYVIDPEWKHAWMLSLEGLPVELRNGNLIRYLSLFGPKKRVLTARRAGVILQELIDLVTPGTVDWDRIGQRAAPPWLWAQSIRAIVDMDPDKRPRNLDDHNYLRRTAWNKAERLAGKDEAQREASRRSGVRDEKTATLRVHGAPEQLGGILAGAYAAGEVDPEQETCLDCRHMREPGLCYRKYDETKRVRHIPAPYRTCEAFSWK